MRRVALRSLFLLAVLAGVLVYFGQGRQFDLPPWLQTRIEARIETQLGGLGVEFGAIRVNINEGWRPRIGLRDVRLSYPDGSPAGQLADAQVALSMRQLFYGQLRPKTVFLAGLSATLRRQADGMALSLADGAGAVRRAHNLPQMIEQWDTYLEQPGLESLVAIEVESISLRYEDLRLSRAWTFDGGYIRLDRAQENIALGAGFSVLSGGDSVGVVEASYTSDIGDTAAEFGIAFTELASQDIAVQSPALGWLEVLRAPISGNLRGSLDSDGRLGQVATSLEIGTGVLQPSDTAQPVAFDGASSYFTYFPDKDVLQFDALSVETGWGSGQVEGITRLGGVRNGRLTQLVGQLRFSDLSLNPLMLYDEQQHFSGATADFKLQLNPFRLTLGEATVNHGDTTVHLSGNVWTDETGWGYALDGTADQVTVPQVVALWPVAAPPKPRKWVRENVLAGRGYDVKLALRSRPDQKPFLSLSFGFEEMRIRFMKTMPPIQRAAGQFSIHGNRLVVSANTGFVQPDLGGAVDIAGTSFIIPDVSVKGPSPAVARLTLEGTGTAALSLLDREPLAVISEAGLPVDLTEGRVRATGTLALPLKDQLPLDEIEYHYTGDIRAARSSKLVPGHVLSAPRLRLSGNQDHVQITGSGAISDIPATVDWRLPIGKNPIGTHRAKGRISLAADTVETFNIGLPPGMVSGTGWGEYVIDLPKGAPPRLTLKSDLQGVGLAIPSLGWRKPAKRASKLSVTAQLGAAPRVDDFQLDAAGLVARGKISLRPGGGLQEAAFADLRIGNWLRSSATITGRGTAAPTLALNGGVLDLRRAPFSSSGSGTGGAAQPSDGGVGPIDFNLSRVQVTDSIALHDIGGRISVQGGLNGRFRGRLNGQTPVDGVLVAQNGGIGMRIRSNDAGGVFRSSGILRHAVGGSFDMSMVPADRPGYFKGQITAQDTRIQQAPALLALVNSISLVGLVNELSGQGVMFSQVDARFELGPTHLKLISSSAVGPSIGLSMDGVYDLKNSVLNMRGVLSPIYILNSVGSVITRKGEGLIGFSFTMRGSSDAPKVVVNPLSGLAPGFLREIFRGQAPLVPGETRAPRKRAPTVSGSDR